MNRVGDAGLAIGIFLMFTELGSTQYDDVFNGAPTLAAGTVLIMGILLLLGACGKSGQFPLQAWLPDAMEGPTPVSALIHAATMVTAGVYLIARSNPIFSANTTLQLIVVSVGALTLLIGCIIGSAKDDIKRVLAWSTVSQIGYMFLGVGLGGGAYALAIIHLLAHGFFKANMFLGAGSVMHGMHDQVDIRRFGALSKHMKITWITFATGWLADHRHPAALRLSSPRSRSSRPRSSARWSGRRGCSAWPPLIGAGLTAFLHDPAVRADVPRSGPLDRRHQAPARVAAAHDDSADPARGRLDRRGLPDEHERGGLAHAVFGEHGEEAHGVLSHA
jgi:NADH-quinone oxidoreductase subunit L